MSQARPRDVVRVMIAGTGASPAIRNALAAAGVVCTDAAAGGATLIFSNREDDVTTLVTADARCIVCLLPGTRAGVTRSLLEAGAADVVHWSADAPARIAHRLRRWAAVDALVESDTVRARFVGESAAFRRFLRDLIEVAAFGAGSVLVLGESGTGKESVAEIVHALDPKANKTELVTVDATTIVPELSGSELFGHERGAFTGATSSRDGAFALADGGTLFLDEIGELPSPLQAQLLRALQERTYKPVGANYWRTSTFRLVCATNRPLHIAIANGGFRADLFHRIATHVIRLPALDERRCDVPLLARHFLKELLPGGFDVDSELDEYLLGRGYPGNIRELRSLIEAIAARYCGSGLVTLGDLPASEHNALAQGRWNDDRFETAIRRALLAGVSAQEIEEAARDTTKRIAVQESGGNLQLASKRLGLSERALQKWRAGQDGTLKLVGDGDRD